MPTATTRVRSNVRDAEIEVLADGQHARELRSVHVQGFSVARTVWLLIKGLGRNGKPRTHRFRFDQKTAAGLARALDSMLAPVPVPPAAAGPDRAKTSRRKP